MKNDSVWTAFELYGALLLKAHPNPELFSKWFGHFRDLETQIMVVPGGPGTTREGNKWTDGGQTWGPIRWPWKANTSNPEWHDRPREWCLEDHLQAIGSTGWDWKAKESRWVGYDFDSIVDHAKGVGASEEDLKRVVENAPAFCDVIRSTRGGGRHIYVFFEPPYPKTETHTHHAALARSILPMMSIESGFDFRTHMDVCGQVLWVYHVDASKENRSFESLKSSEFQLTGKEIPPNWLDHLDVVKGERTKVKVQGWTSEGKTKGDELDEMSQAHARIPLDEVHKSIIDQLMNTGFSVYWVYDHHLLQTHTKALENLTESWAEAGHPMKGPFETLSDGSDPGKPNCFMRPVPNGGWDVYRFGRGTVEHSLWAERGAYTYCPYNQEPTLRLAAIGAGGVECSDPKKGYQFQTLGELHKALVYLGAKLNIPEVTDRELHIMQRALDNRLIVTISRHKGDSPKDFDKWEMKPRVWTKLLFVKAAPENDNDSLLGKYDERIRLVKEKGLDHTGTCGGISDCWMLKDASGAWVIHPKDHLRDVLSAEGVPEIGIKKVFGLSIDNAWTHVVRPFEEEYPGGRSWNYGSPQLLYEPADIHPEESPHHPHWDLILEHLGEELNDYIPQLEWCRDWNICTGGDYLKAWISVLIKEPFEKLPYLFFWGRQNCGKSIYYEAIALLMSKGVVKADTALTNSNDFNGELANAVLGVIDEVDVSRAGMAAYNKVKEWITCLTISIHAKYKQVVEVPSFIHLVQMSNYISSLPVFGQEGEDTRATAMGVQDLTNEIPKKILLDHLRTEASHFMLTLKQWPMPAPNGRLRLPYIDTQSKLSAMESNQDPLEIFVAEQCYKVDGSVVLFQDFYSEFIATLDTFNQTRFTKHIVRKYLTENFPVGTYSGNQLAIGNLNLTGDTGVKEARLVVKGRKLKRETEL